MTEKRFTFHHDVDGIDYIQDETNGYCHIVSPQLCRLLNALHEENEQLKADKQLLIDFIKKEFPKSHKHILEGFE